MSYLIYTTEQDAWNRSETEGIDRGLAYHVTGRGTRYVSSPRQTSSDEWALPVDSYSLTDDEAQAVVDSFTPKPVPKTI